ncbi:LexA family transcriptional regulator [Fibrella forsythiae]|uniref:LexA family transcriptional regulator n=1 Tax=Fibrella forsythiae TaxID=2817061 RepID=A0ABS3JTD9_9BACT|nr:LexA family transcriptional regulator [Fibrella forsythiae]MBO0953292.1 LexA family transcriptional regulator [Fibrella forsythiae]
MIVEVKDWATAGEKISSIRKAKGLNQSNFGKPLKIPQGNLSDYEKGKVIPGDRIVKDIIELYKVNEGWWETGEGEILLEESLGKPNMVASLSGSNATQSIVREIPGTNSPDYVPYYDVEITAGRLEELFNDNQKSPQGYIYAPHYRGCIACHVKGDSMNDRIFPGSRLYVYYLKNKKYIDFGQVYLVVLEGYRLLKYIDPDPTDESRVILRSHNEEQYKNWPVEKADILHLFLVKGYENQNAN